jgi:FkbM family methyltransferase
MNPNAVISNFQKRISQNKLSIRILKKIKNQIECIIGYSLATTSKGSENGEEALLKKLAPKLKTFFDVGANKGAWTLALLKNSSNKTKGYLFEPSPKNANALKKLFINQKNIFVFRKALGNRCGKFNFLENKTNDEHSRVLAIQQTANARNLIYLSTVDNEIKRLKINDLTLLKIDTEGFDSLVIQGAEQSLKKGIIKNVQFEYNSMWKESGSTLSFVISFLSNYGFNTYLIQPLKLELVENPSEIEVFKYANFLATRYKHFEPRGKS